METKENIVGHVVVNHPMNPNLTDEPIYRRRISIIRDFALNTTTHGIPGIARGRSTQNRLFWSLVFMIFSGVMLYFIIQAIRTYFEYPTQTRVNITSERIQYFPALTICNAGGVRADAVFLPYAHYVQNFNVTTPSGERLVFDQADFIKLFFRNLINENKSIDEYVFTLNSMLLSCEYAGIECSVKDFIEFDSSVYGRCYTFNAKTKNGSVRYSHDIDNTDKLILRLYLHAHQYVANAVEGVAMMAMVHDNKQLPLIERRGMALAPGFQHRLAYTKRNIFFLSSPYSTCTNNIPPVMKFMFEKYVGADYAYSEDLCYILCAQAYIYERCKCVNPAQWNARSIVLPGTNDIVMAPLCNTSNICFKQAVNNFDLTHSIRGRYCSYCLQQCSITNFAVKSSLSIAPPEWLVPDIRAFVENSSVPLPFDWSSRWNEYIRSSYVSIELLAESSLIETYTQMAALNFIDVISNVGGQTGLWIGISFLSLMELIEMFYRLIRFQNRISQSVTIEDQKQRELKQ
ncbi:unnamed protein product [Rotaria sordida]|uniref:Uncharacterized protein n=1 Tax=Rotaria sordida TaxID=392033 RepID=A0A813V171_9BILA|nr:unnamed protein product [Rotaria sordida]